MVVAEVLVVIVVFGVVSVVVVVELSVVVGVVVFIVGIFGASLGLAVASCSFSFGLLCDLLL